MSSEELDAFRSELLRQKIIFEAELRRQREDFEDRLGTVAQELAAREADCRNLQSVITILGKKVDALSEQVSRRPPTPRRMPTPPRTPSTMGDDDQLLIKPPGMGHRGSTVDGGGPSSARRPGSISGPPSNTFIRRPSPLISIGSPANHNTAGMMMHRIPSSTQLSRGTSPARNAQGGSARGGSDDQQQQVGENSPGSHPHRPVLSRTASEVTNPTSTTAADGAATTTTARRGARGSVTSTPSTASPRVVARGRRRSDSLTAKKRVPSEHRLRDVKATDRW